MSRVQEHYTKAHEHSKTGALPGRVITHINFDKLSYEYDITVLLMVCEIVSIKHTIYFVPRFLLDSWGIEWSHSGQNAETNKNVAQTMVTGVSRR